ncbi:hypothetical protein LOTGIDRAFT_162019 [Lottia gigantea]|uniref:Uncharacterized protein n=1 Tax=Lottia gigantea TaxID=225164 RepID=V4AD19_LOTGI|nr:hypothetical protein LOTGIDRAFT_162019 [Lottia gigantea]ESO92995.1 hypothetical protein LOTGIDRAFT_162019 [Lottia gigantea]
MQQRQLYEMDFFKPEAEANELLLILDLDKLKYAPLTNLGCESQLGKLDNRIRFAGGMTTITTHSRMNIVSSNGLLCNSQFVDLADKDKKIRWNWGSETVQKVKQLEEFLSTVRASKDMALKKKEELKLKKNIKMLQALETCKRHGGPVTSSTIPLLERLDQRELLKEIFYLRNTVAPDIRQKRCVKCATGNFRYETFSEKELRQIIR